MNLEGLLGKETSDRGYLRLIIQTVENGLEVTWKEDTKKQLWGAFKVTATREGVFMEGKHSFVAQSQLDALQGLLWRAMEVHRSLLDNSGRPTERVYVALQS